MASCSCRKKKKKLPGSELSTNNTPGMVSICTFAQQKHNHFLQDQILISHSCWSLFYCKYCKYIFRVLTYLQYFFARCSLGMGTFHFTAYPSMCMFMWQIKLRNLEKSSHIFVLWLIPPFFFSPSFLFENSYPPVLLGNTQNLFHSNRGIIWKPCLDL